MFEKHPDIQSKVQVTNHWVKYATLSIPITCWISLVDTPTGYMSEDGGSPRPVDPNAMDVDSVNSPPAVSHQTGEWKNS